MNTKKIQKFILKLKDSFLEESEENKKMLDIFVKQIEGTASEDEIDYAIDLITTSVKKLRELSPLWEMHKDGIDLKSVKWSSH